MNAPFVPVQTVVRLADLRDPDERAAIARFVRAHPQGTPFHLPAWIEAVERGTRNRALVLVAERGGALIGLLPLNEIHSPIFGRLLASTGFAVDGGLLVDDEDTAAKLLAAAERLALRHSCPTIELRGGPVSDARPGWALRTQSHCGFVSPLAADDEAQLTAVPRKQRAEVRKSLANAFEIRVGTDASDRAEHYAVYAESVRNLGTPVFPRALFDAVLDGFGDAADILTVRHEGRAIASVLSLYWRGAVMPYWGGGTWDARRLRANLPMRLRESRSGLCKPMRRSFPGRSATLNFWRATSRPASSNVIWLSFCRLQSQTSKFCRPRQHHFFRNKQGTHGLPSPAFG